jgi:hypothetical protein
MLNSKKAEAMRVRGEKGFIVAVLPYGNFSGQK